ncbi:hypothetical protein [Capnocytophaga canimorsus]|uniref:hypothetical protein n=1 Tax=Capnocytophaga canimorsus TaxID=28188 RepID=UPI00385CB666
MTTAEKLAEVTAQIRKDIPRLMELKEGCWIKQKTSEKDFIFKVVAVKDDFLKCVLGFAEFIFLAKDIVNSLKSFEIIGHEIMLYDVLEWLSLCKKSLYFIDSECGFGILDVDCHRFYHFKFDINLKSPYLKDQHEKLIKFLYGVMKNRLWK